MAGAPLGNQNAAKGKRWAHAVERAMNSYPNKPVSLEVNKGLDAAAFEFVTRMMAERDLGFFKEFGDRIDGKPAQTLAGDPDSPLQMVSRVERSIVRANPKD